jgi:hypothetical protein
MTTYDKINETSENNKGGSIYLAIAVTIFIIAPLNKEFGFFPISWNILIAFLSFIFVVISIFVAYANIIHSIFDKYLYQIIFAALLYVLNSISGSFADYTIMSRTSIPPDILPRAQTVLSISYSCYFILVIFMMIGLAGYFSSLFPVTEFKKIKSIEVAKEKKIFEPLLTILEILISKILKLAKIAWFLILRIPGLKFQNIIILRLI